MYDGVCQPTYKTFVALQYNITIADLTLMLQT